MSAPDLVEIHPLDAPLDATVVVPGSRSLTNRALVCAGLAAGTSTLTGALFADDTEAMLDAWARLGADPEVDPPARSVRITGLAGAIPPGPVDLDARLSGTTSRFLLAVCGLGSGPYRLDGRPPLRARPMEEGIRVLRALGRTVVEGGVAGHLPVTISGGPHDEGTPAGGEVTLAGDVSSQFLSGTMLVAPCWEGGGRLRIEGDLVSRPYVEMTRSVMAAFGAATAWEDDTIVIGGGGYRAATYAVEPDAATASYFFGAALVAGGRVRVEGLGGSTTQGDLRILDVFARMGAAVRVDDAGIEVGRDTGVPLRGVTADLRDCSDMAQTFAVVAAGAEGPSEVTGIGFIRHKESDRVGGVVTELRRCGIDATETDDGFVVTPGPLRPAVVQTYDDHRMAMSFALLGLRAPGIRIADPGVVAKTVPGYWDLLDGLRPEGGIVGRVQIS